MIGMPADLIAALGADAIPAAGEVERAVDAAVEKLFGEQS